MSLLIPNPPSSVLAAFSSGLPAFLPGGPTGTVISESFVGHAPPIPTAADVSTGTGAPNVSGAMQAFVLSLTDAANNTGQISPDPAGWSLFAGDVLNKTVVGRVVQQGQAWKLVAVQYGPIVWETMNTALKLKGAPPTRVQVQDFEERLLAIPALNLEFFWLVAQNSGSADLFFPTPAAVPLTVFMGSSLNPIETPHFLAEIRPLAASLLTMRAGYGA